MGQKSHFPRSWTDATVWYTRFPINCIFACFLQLVELGTLLAAILPLAVHVAPTLRGVFTSYSFCYDGNVLLLLSS